MQHGTVYWFTGLSGAGKTALGKLFFSHVRAQKPNVVFCDGDALREVFAPDAGHGLAERRKLAMSYARLGRMLADQGMDVVCATISMFHEVRDWNRAHIPRYREIYVQVPIEVLIQRDQKGLYSRALRGEIGDVMGIDLPIEAPRNPDLVVENDGSASPEAIVARIVQALSNERELS
jgi:adenylylsulfate kinase-like enzyme